MTLAHVLSNNSSYIPLQYLHYILDYLHYIPWYSFMKYILNRGRTGKTWPSYLSICYTEGDDV